MIENTFENKGRFLRLYLEQDFENVNVHGDVHKYKPDGIVKNFLYHRIKPYPVETSYALLKPLSSITDEDAIALWDILNPNDSKYAPEYRLKEAKDWLNDSFTIGDVKFKWKCVQGFDFLRFRGYFIPAMGLTTDEIISYGWAKYKEIDKQ